MPRSIGEFDSNPKLRDLKARIPTIDELMRRPQPPPWWEFLPPPAQPNDNPFGPVPIIPPLSPPPIEVDPPSRPPEWSFGPPYISSAPTQPFSFVPSHAPFVRTREGDQPRAASPNGLQRSKAAFQFQRRMLPRRACLAPALLRCRWLLHLCRKNPAAFSA